MAAVFEVNGEEMNFFCGGSLIHGSLVMTAAHCVQNKDPKTMKVRAGEWDAKSLSEPIPHQDRRVAQVVIHPEFNQANLFNDIAILVVDTPFVGSDSVDVVCLPDPRENRIDTDKCIATGWGQDQYENGKYQTTLRQVGLPMVNKEECQARLRTTRLGKYFKLHESFVCAGGIPEEDTCTGDGGGPLVCPLSVEPDRYLQMGIVSWGIGCGNSTPAVYTNVQHFMPWLTTEFRKLIGS
ncbi:hypothetical protein AAG570_005529 [Ranatra chinensis]|uniref:Phenoloxidase-activating factor 2 n=1 Tax=Ranatra chinensis TaxID=642074 RepID=A0ABD0XXP5_9HEMI